MSAMPGVSIVIPHRSPSHFLESCITSVAKETYAPLECILVLNNISIEDKYLSEQLRRVNKLGWQVIYSNSHNLADALNLAIRNSKYDYIRRFDSDDIWNVGVVQEQISVMLNQSHGRVVACGTQMDIFCEDNEDLGSARYAVHNWLLKVSLFFRCPFSHPTVMFRKEDFNTAGRYRPEYNGIEDYDLWIRLSPLGKFVNLSTSGISHRIHPGQFSQNYRELNSARVLFIRNHLTAKTGVFSKLKALGRFQFSEATAKELSNRNISPLVVINKGAFTIINFFIRFVIYISVEIKKLRKRLFTHAG
jgi:glycosyltransferase involved in cell wall biosynthesis